MYRIGMFSKINKVTVKTLRYYDEVGLLIPAYVDEENGYRYYTSEQLPIIHKIKALRQMGFTIDEITLIIKGIKATEIFENRKKELEKAIEESNKQASQINYYLHNLKEDFIMKYEVLVKELLEVIVYSKRMILKSYDDYFKVIPAIGKEIGDANPGMKCSVPEYCFNIYHDGEYKEKDIDSEFCEAVPKRGKDTETIKFKKIDKVDSAACVMHNRPKAEYDNYVEDLLNDLKESVDIGRKNGVNDSQIVLDPGVGFGKTYEHNLQIINECDKVVNLGFPVLLGTSRKSVIGLTLDIPAPERSVGTCATTVIGYERGCRIFRVHDVIDNYQALLMAQAICKQR